MTRSTTARRGTQQEPGAPSPATVPARSAPWPNRWAAPSTLVLSVIGLAVSTYLTVEHWRSPGTLACPATATVNCARVTTSEQASLFGVPVALLGVVFFVVMVAICLPVAWRIPRLDRVRLAVASVGAAFVVYLVYAELFLVGALCLWCTAVHVVAVALFAAVLFTTAGREAPIAISRGR